MAEIDKKTLNKIVTGAEFARIVKISRQLVSKMACDGVLVRRPDKKYDLSNPVNQDYIRKHFERVELAAQQIRINSELPTAGERREQRKIAEIEAGNREISTENSSPLGLVDRAEAERLKTIAQVEDLRIKNQKRREELIEKTLVSRVFAQLYQIDINGFRTLPASVSSNIAAIAAIDDPTAISKIEKMVTEEIFKILQRSKRLIADFLASIAAPDEVAAELEKDSGIC